MNAKLLAVYPVLMVRDINASLSFYYQLGFCLVFQDSKVQPRYAGILRDSVELHLQWHDAAEWETNNDRPTYRFLVPEVDALSEEFASVKNLDRTTVQDTHWGTREFHVRDPDRNGLQFYRQL